MWFRSSPAVASERSTTSSTASSWAEPTPCSPPSPVSAVADYTEVRDVARVEVCEDRDVELHLLFDPEHNLEKRIIQEQGERLFQDPS